MHKWSVDTYCSLQSVPTLNTAPHGSSPHYSVITSSWGMGEQIFWKSSTRWNLPAPNDLCIKNWQKAVISIGWARLSANSRSKNLTMKECRAIIYSKTLFGSFKIPTICSNLLFFPSKFLALCSNYSTSFFNKLNSLPFTTFITWPIWVPF